MTPSAASLKAIRERKALSIDGGTLVIQGERIHIPADELIAISEDERDNLFAVIDALAGALRETLAIVEARWRSERTCDNAQAWRDDRAHEWRAALALVDPA